MKHELIPNFTKKTIIYRPQKNQSVQFNIGASCQITIIIPITTSIETSIQFNVHDTDSNVCIIGLVSIRKEEKVFLHTDQYHSAPRSTSNLLIKSVIADSAHFYYDGYIRVAKEAQRTDAYQRNENLLLSDTTYAESKPGLEIMANDVRCTHGATISMIPQEQIWYLKSRGIAEKTAKALIVSGFLQSPIEKLDEKIQFQVKKQLHIS